MSLNNLSDIEWKVLKLPPPNSAVPRPNIQLPDLVDPNLSDMPKAQVVNGVECGVSLDADVATLGVGCTDYGGGSTVVSLGGVQAPLKQVPTPPCHDVCFPGLGGEVICLFDDLGETEVDDDIVPSPTACFPSTQTVPLPDTLVFGSNMVDNKAPVNTDITANKSSSGSSLSPPRLGPDYWSENKTTCPPPHTTTLKLTGIRSNSLQNVYFQDISMVANLYIPLENMTPFSIVSPCLTPPARRYTI